MADEGERSVDETTKSVDEASTLTSEQSNALENFVTGHYKQQKNAGRLESTEEISDERTNQFFSRAIAESRRMSSEVNKSNKKLDALHAEFGIDMVNAWHAEHASEVLNSHEQQLVMQAKYQGSVGDAGKNNG